MSEDVKEYPVKDWPGWIRIVRGTTRRYRSPSGLEISGNKFYKLSQKHISSGIIPENEIVEDDKSASFFTKMSSGFSSKKKSEEPKTENENENDVLNLGEPKPKSGRPSGNKASARELANSIQTLLVIITSIIALAMKFPDLNMQDAEVKAISIPLANIMESSSLNEKFGRLLASSGDYQLLGYALYLYGSRVYNAIVERGLMQNVKPVRKSSENKAATTDGFSGEHLNGTNRGANLPYSSTGPRRFT